MTKINKCNKCKSTENLFVYSKSPCKTRQYYMCRKCNTERVRKYRQTDKGKEAITRAVRKSEKKYRNKANMRSLTNYHVKKGNINFIETCEVCNDNKTDVKHHIDYLTAYNLVFCCHSCHADIHAGKHPKLYTHIDDK